MTINLHATALNGRPVSPNECRELARIVRSSDIYLKMWADTGKVHGPANITEFTALVSRLLVGYPWVTQGPTGISR